MNNDKTKLTHEATPKRRTHWSLAGAFLATTALAGCSGVPDAINPVEWYNSTVELFSGDDAKDQAGAQTAQSGTPQADRGKPPPGSDKNFPKLSSVDQQRQQADNRAGGLVADTEKRQYAPAIARQGEASSTLQAAAPPRPPAPSATAAAPTQPAPPAQPAIPVISSAAGAAPAAPPAPAPQVAALSSPADQKAFAERMQARLDEIRARAGQPASGLSASLAATPVAATPGNPTGTVVISSEGVEVGGGVMPAGVEQAALQPGQTLVSTTRQGARVPRGAVKVATINFNNGSARLTSRDRNILANVKRLLNERGGHLHVVGHASSRTRSMDPIRHKMVNFKVSIDRADVVVRELMRQGVGKDAISAGAVSDSEPVFYEIMPSGEAGNRRAEIYLAS